MIERKGDWIQTYTGRQFWPLDPRPDDVCIEDIAHALSQQCRYSGHTIGFYSVAQHSVLVSRTVKPEHALWGLLHDAAEAYLVDVPRPVKGMLPVYREMEALVLGAIAECFGLTLPMPDDVKWADGKLLATEKRDLIGPEPAPWADMPKPLDVKIRPWTPETAKRRFLDEFAMLTENHGLRTRVEVAFGPGSSVVVDGTRAIDEQVAELIDKPPPKVEPAPHFVIAAAITNGADNILHESKSDTWPADFCGGEADHILDLAEALQRAADERYGG